MPGFGHQTVFGLCMALVALAAVSVVCVALLLIERQNIDVLQQHVSNLRQENSALRLELNDYHNGHLIQQEAAAR